MENFADANMMENDTETHKCDRNSPEELTIRDLRGVSTKEEPCFWCELENKCGKKIGDVTLAELTEYSRGKYVFDFCTDYKGSKRMAKRAAPASRPPPPPPLAPPQATVEALEPATPGELSAPEEQQPEQSPLQQPEQQPAAGEARVESQPLQGKAVRRAPCQHSFALSGGRCVQLTSLARRAVVLHRPMPLSDRNPLVTLISTLTDIFIAVTFTVTCWILFSKSRSMNV